MRMKLRTDRRWKIWEQMGLPAVIIVIAVVLSFSSPYFLTLNNFKNFINQAAIVAIAAAGMTFAIACGSFDLSIGSVLALAACVTAKIVVGCNVGVAILAGLAVGAGLGLVNGLIITRIRIPAFIATLAMMTIIRGLVLLYTGGHDINVFTTPEREASFKFVGGGHLLSVPLPIAVMLLVFVLGSVLLRHTPFGRHVCAVGSNEEAAGNSGLNVALIKTGVFILVGFTAAIAAVIQTSQLMGVNGATAGLGLELQAISVVVLGGTSLSGGKARLFGTMLGAILMALINNGMNLCLQTAPVYYQYLVLGLILLMAVALDEWRSRSSGRTRTWMERYEHGF